MSDDFLTVTPRFRELGLNSQLINPLEKQGYHEPTPIQAKIIPHILSGCDVVGQAQTGTGKTAAFALPLLNNLGKGGGRGPRVLVLAPTRELALQVSESFVRYGSSVPKLNVLAVFGGAEYTSQLNKLRSGVDVVVGTPGRVMDHIRRGTLDLSHIEALVLDEADEMLKMGFIDDVEWIIAQAPQERQIALFSATMPSSIRRIAATHLSDPVEITIASRTAAATAIEQRFHLVKSVKEKKDALAKILAGQDTDGVLIFVRTKLQTVELAEHLGDLGYNATALNGDIAQNQRIRCVDHLKAGKIDILVATDVAARGLDVERVSHVINFDIPFDTESYIHRIGRTGRAGRDGKAILFITPREKSMLKSIERTTRQKIEPLILPTVTEINSRRVENYKQRITQTLATDCSLFGDIISEYCQDNDVPVELAAAALAKMAQGEKSLLLKDSVTSGDQHSQQERKRNKKDSGKRASVGSTGRPQRSPEEGMHRYRLEVGELDGVKPGNIVGAIANEGDIDSDYIGRISIFDEFSTVDLPEGMPRAIQKVLFRARINGKIMKLRKEAEAGVEAQKGSSGGRFRKVKPGDNARNHRKKRDKRSQAPAKANHH